MAFARANGWRIRFECERIITNNNTKHEKRKWKWYDEFWLHSTYVFDAQKCQQYTIQKMGFVTYSDFNSIALSERIEYSTIVYRVVLKAIRFYWTHLCVRVYPFHMEPNRKNIAPEQRRKGEQWNPSMRQNFAILPISWCQSLFQWSSRNNSLFPYFSRALALSLFPSPPLRLLHLIQSCYFLLLTPNYLHLHSLSHSLLCSQEVTSWIL